VANIQQQNKTIADGSNFNMAAVKLGTLRTFVADDILAKFKRLFLHFMGMPSSGAYPASLSDNTGTGAVSLLICFLQ
jgi:hypothetical protein